MEKRTVLDHVGVDQSGRLCVRLAKQHLSDAGDIVVSEWHRTIVEPGSDVEAQMAAVTVHLANMGYPAVTEDTVAEVKAAAAIEWTPERLVAAEAAREVVTVDPPPPPWHAIEPWRFWAIVELQGLKGQIDTAVAGIADHPTARAVARARLNHSPRYHRDDPLFDQLGAIIGLSPEAIDGLFEAAAAL